MKKLSFILFAIVALFGVHSAKAWGGFGHGCIAYIAEQHLTPEAEAKCLHYLRHSLPYYASWMDHWKGAKIFKDVNLGHSVPANEEGDGLLIRRRAVGHLYNALAELGDGKYKNLPDSVMRQRIINMIHYVGDMHCPSHVGFSKEKFPQYHIAKYVYRGKKRISYHGFWDGAVSIDRNDWEIEDYAKKIDKVSKRQVKVWQSGTLTDWGRDIAKAGHRGFELFPEGKDILKMSKEEKEPILELADEMALMAAYRLAYVLNTIFADGNIPAK